MKLTEPVSSKTASLIFGILILVFLIGFYILAWQEPIQAPPVQIFSQPRLFFAEP